MSSNRRNCLDNRAGENIPRSGNKSARRTPAMLTRGFCSACSKALSPGSKKLIPLTVFPSTSRGLVRRSSARTGREVVQGGEVSQIASIAAQKDLPQIDQAVDRLLDGCELARWRAFAVFHLSVVLEKGHIVGGGFDTQDDAGLVVHFDRALAEAVLHAGTFDTGRELRAYLLGQLWRDPPAQERGDLLGLHAQHGLADELFVERAKGADGTERQIGGVFHLQQAPVIVLSEYVQYRATPFGVTIQRPMQLVR